MFAYLFGCFQEPLLGCCSVGDGFLSGERFRGHNKEGGLGVQFLQGLSHVGAVDVRHEVSPQVGAGLG